MEYFSVLEKKEILSYATAWMNLDDIRLNEMSQSHNSKPMGSSKAVLRNNLTLQPTRKTRTTTTKNPKLGERKKSQTSEQKKMKKK